MMPPEIKQLAGFMNTDDPEDVIPVSHHKDARNIRLRGNPGNMRVEIMQGTRLIANELPGGFNQSIGAFFDELRQRIYWFNHSSIGAHGIYVYYIRTTAIAQVAVVGVNTEGDIFDFDLDTPIFNVKMLYGDATQGDILFFNNSQKQPCQINVTRAITGDYGTIERSFIDVAKEPPILPPYVVYEDDNTATVNNFRKKLFKFKTRAIFGNREKSVTSSESELPLPVNYLDSNIDKDPTKNARIAIVVPTGSPEVKKIEILAAISGADKDGISGTNQFGDFFLIQTLDKGTLNIPDNDLYTFRFKNDQAYVTIDTKESAQLFDLVPLEANALEFLNGNVPIYGGIKEGYDLVLFTATGSSSSVSERTTQYPFIFATSQNGDSGFGTGNIHIVVIGSITVGQTFSIYTTNDTISFTATVATTANVIAGLSTAATLLGYTIVSSDTENLVIAQNGESLQRFLATNVLIAPTDSFVYDWNSKYSFGVVYFDEKGRTNGVVTSLDISLPTVNYTETTGTPNIPKLSLSISSRPPIWAKYYQLVRTKNTTKSNFLYWVSDKTYKDTKFAYIGIENLNKFIKENPGAAHLAWSVAPNDRIRFVKVLSGSVNTIYTAQDFEIQGQVFSPEINGIVREGQYMKIALPTTSGTFDFGTEDFNNYFIQLYTPAQSVANGLDLYYEFGERYSIGNAGTVNAFHQGMLQNQTSNLSQPATFDLLKGDDYYRSRTINTGGTLYYQIFRGERGAGRHTMGVTFIERDFTDTNITTGNSPLQDLSGWTFADPDRAIIKMGVSSGTYTFRAKGVIKVNFLKPDTFSFFFWDEQGNETYAVNPTAVPEGDSTFTFDCTFQLPSGSHVSFVGWSEGDQSNSKWYTQTDFTVTIVKEYTVDIIDPNFSDYFESKVNSNGRAWAQEPEAMQTYFPSLMRWGLANEADTNINQVNRFYPNNFDYVDRAKGAIQRFKVREMILRIFQERATCRKGIFGNFVQDKSGGSILATTDQIITPNNADYYDGEYGLGSQQGALVSSSKADYIVDPVRGNHLRLSEAGYDPINVQNKGQYVIGPMLAKYSADYNRSAGGLSKIIGAFDYIEQECVLILQGGTNEDLGEIPDEAIHFNEVRNAYSCYSDLKPEWIVAGQDKLYMWKDGQLYIQDNETTYCNFFGVQYYPSIELVFNQNVALRKTFKSLSYQSNQYWVASTNGDVKTSEINQFTNLQQISQLKTADFELRGDYRDAAFLRDANSRANAVEALNEGDFLEGQWISINFTYQGSEYSYLHYAYCLMQQNNRNF